MGWQQSIAATGKFERDADLASRTTLGVGGKAKWMYRPVDAQGLIQAMALIPRDMHIFPLGRGSNLLISDAGIDGLVLDLNALSDIHVEALSLTAGAGARMGKIAQLAANASLAGLEFMATVPGDLGGGVAMNAGAFGQQVSDVLASIVILHRNGTVQTLTRPDLNMVYRHTHLPADALVLSATLVLRADDAESIRQRMRDMRKKRTDTQPLALPNCGSVFKNPEGDFSARLIESVGLKGQRMGKASISDKHANFIVNEGGATCEDVLALIRLARNTVYEQHHVWLEPEVRFVGCDL